ncbi:MAG: hypothetical protein KDE27_28430 [Planctomycetes bacterium]|nr:hypothetical protein [Planctomycetota bacterium]
MIGRDDVEALRAAGFDDVAIHDVTQVASYFHYINRIADALGVELEDEAVVRPWGEGGEPGGAAGKGPLPSAP